MKIEFFSTVSGLTETFPIIDSRKSIPKWMYSARQQYQNKKEPSITRCPGIVELMTSGFIVPAWHDIEIHAENTISSYAPSSDLETLLGKPPLQTQDGNGIAKFIPKRPWSHKDILKINTPWHIKSNLKFLMIPIPYPDSFGFESTIGILDPSISSEINIQGYINGNGVLDIKAGDPLCQLIPLTEKTYKLVVRDMNTKDSLWIKKRAFFNNLSFILNKSLIKNAYDKFINR